MEGRVTGLGPLELKYVLAFMSQSKRKRWLGLVATGLVLLAIYGPTGGLDLVLALVFVIMFMAVVARMGFVAAVGFLFVGYTLNYSPPWI